jgi:hypothetical protein
MGKEPLPGAPAPSEIEAVARIVLDALQRHAVHGIVGADGPHDTRAVIDIALNVPAAMREIRDGLFALFLAGIETGKK